MGNYSGSHFNPSTQEAGEVWSTKEVPSSWGYIVRSCLKIEGVGEQDQLFLVTRVNNSCCQEVDLEESQILGLPE